MPDDILTDDINNDTDQQEVNIVDWRQQLPKELRDHPALEKFKSPVDVVKSYIEVQKFIGREKIPVPPKEGATQEDWDVVFKALGKPDSPDGYEIDLSQFADEEDEQVPVDEEVLNEFKQKAHELNLLPAQAQELVEWFVDKQKTAQKMLAEQSQREYQEAEAQLRKEWGRAYEEKVKKVQRLVKEFADEDVLEELQKFGNNPALIKFIANIADRLSNDAFPGKGSSIYKTPEEIQSEIRRMLADKNHPVNDQFHPEHKAAIEYLQNLYKMLEPSRE
ncbi:MAG: hypothetical protein KatS3mg087_1626 [Patescibacteria group bacterium]|nr:MAG: hypothetical protein KatS3mg087_1626 [Patescibacteria group bacterium]